MTDKNDGGPAFPCDELIARDETGALHGAPISSHGMSLRDYLAAHAPVSFDAAISAFGADPNFNRDNERAAFFAVWSLLRFEYADTMLEARKHNV